MLNNGIHNFCFVPFCFVTEFHSSWRWKKRMCHENKTEVNDLIIFYVLFRFNVILLGTSSGTVQNGLW